MESWGVRAWEWAGKVRGGRYGFMGKVEKFDGMGVESAWVMGFESA